MVIAKFEMEEAKKKVSLHVKGHAGANKYGHDIVCAAASILAYTLAQNVSMARSRGLLKYNPTIKLKEGDAIITARAADEESYSELLHTFLVIQSGYQVLAHNYADYVILEMFGQDSMS